MYLISVVVCMVKGSEVTETLFSMKSKVEIMAIHYCMREHVFFKILSHTDTVHVAEEDDASKSAFFIYMYPEADEIRTALTGSPQNSAYMYMYMYVYMYMYSTCACTCTCTFACYVVMTSAWIIAAMTVQASRLWILLK